jgi:phospholipid/cholesterol/gamma-HCH transport system permease protein
VNSPTSRLRYPLLDLAWLARALVREWRMLRFGALTLVAALSPSVWDKSARQAAAQALCRAAWRVLPGYLLLVALVTAVLTRVIAVSAASYGLSRLALEAVVRVFVIELLPLAGAAFVATRFGLEAVTRLMPGRDFLGATAPPSVARVVAIVAGNALAVVVLCVISGMLALVVAYVVSYGLSPWGLADYARLIGQVFDPVTAATLGLKVGLFALAVGIAPATVVLDAPNRDTVVSGVRVMARMTLMLLLVEMATLALKQI